MSVTTTAKFNTDVLVALLPANGVLSVTGSASSTATKTVGHSAATDQQITDAIATASTQFVDRDANGASLRDRAQQALAANATFLAIATPTNAQVVAQVQRLTRENNALIRLAVGALDDISNT